MEEKNKILSLIVGCGGSGVTTMIALNRLLAENPEMRYRIYREIFYIAVDTETAMLNKFNTEVKKQMGGAKMPLIEDVLLSKDVNVLNSVIKPNFVTPFEVTSDPEILKGLDRLKDNWWFNADGAPFAAPLVSNLLLGAGQCPPASYCLAWSKLKKIEASIKNIIATIKRRGVGDPDVLTHLNVFVVAGLSGGTGRGSWNLITFKIRQCFAKEGVSIDPVGIFFDANVFENVCKKKGKEQARAIRVNASTGLSELSCWLSTGREQKGNKFRYSLPDMRMPWDPQTDVLDTTVGISPLSGAPVNSAYLICGPSKAAVLQDNVQYHEMAGAGLYALITNSDLSGERVNNSNPYNSFAATTFEVDAVRLQSFFEAIAQGVALEGLKECKDDVSDRVKEFLSEVPIAVDVQEASDILPVESGGTFLQAVNAAVLAACAGRLKSISDKLPTLKPAQAEKDAVREVEKLLGAVTEKVIEDAVKTAAATTLKGIDPLTKVKEAVLKMYKGSRKERPSVGRVRKFMDALLSKIEAARLASSSGFSFDDPSGVSDVKVDARTWILGLVREFSKRTMLEKLSGAKSFSPREIQDLVTKSGSLYTGSIPNSVLFVHFAAIRKKIEAFFKPAEEYISELVDACDRFAKVCDRAKTMLENEAPIAAGGKTGDDPFKLLFATPKNAEDALPAMDSPKRFYLRVLKPVFEDEQELRALLLKEGNLRIESGVLDFIRDAIDPENGALFKLGSVDADASAEIEFTKQLVEVVKANVSVDDQFLEREFTFYKVLERNIPHWNARIKQLLGNRTKFENLCDQFESFLGIAPDRDSVTKEFRLPAPDDLMLAISESMARSCSPWWITDLDPESSHYTVKVFLPEEQAKFKNGEQFPETLSSALSFANVEVAWLDDKNAGATPFSVIAFTADSVPSLSDTEAAKGMHPLDKIRSLDYHQNADVRKWLKWAEDSKGRSIFEQRDNNKGIGYVSPIFVNTPELAAARWRPWAPLKKDDTVKRDLALEVLRYGFLGVGLDESDRKTLTDTLGLAADLPLFQYVKTGQICQILRRPYQKREGEVIPNRHVAWTASAGKPKTLCTSISNLDSYLRGEGKGKSSEKDKEEGGVLREQILEEMGVFEEKFRKDIGDKFYRKMTDARDEWFHEQWLQAADAKDKSVWDKLING